MELLYKGITPDGKRNKIKIDCKDARAYEKLINYLQDNPETQGLAFLLKNAQDLIKDCETFETIELCDVYSAKAKGEKMNTLPIVKEYEVRKFKTDLEKCLNNVLSDFPEFLNSRFNLNSRFKIIFEPVPSGNWSIMSISRSIGNNYRIFFDSLALYCLFDDDRKEGGLAHELSEALHLKKNSKRAITRTLERWYSTNKRNYRILSEKHADLDAARRGYGLKLIKALEPYEGLESEVSVEGSEIRIKNIEDYLKNEHISNC